VRSPYQAERLKLGRKRTFPIDMNERPLLESAAAAANGDYWGA